jgi:hypothetical protein
MTSRMVGAFAPCAARPECCGCVWDRDQREGLSDTLPRLAFGTRVA